MSSTALNEETSAASGGGFEALMGADRGRAFHDRLDAADPSPAAHALLAQTLPAGPVRSNALTELHRHREALHSPLVAQMLDTVCVRALGDASGRRSEHVRLLLAAAALRDGQSRILMTVDGTLHAWPAGESAALTCDGAAAVFACGRTATVDRTNRTVRAFAVEALSAGKLCRGCRAALRNHPELNADALNGLLGAQRAQTFKTQALALIRTRLVMALAPAPLTASELAELAAAAFRDALLDFCADWAAAESARVSCDLLGRPATLTAAQWRPLLAGTLRRIEQPRRAGAPKLTVAEIAAPLRDELSAAVTPGL